LGYDRYVLKPKDPNNCSRLELYREGGMKHSYLAKPYPKKINDFLPAINNSYRDDATFMNSILLAHFLPDQWIMIHNQTLISHKGTQSTIENLSDIYQIAKKIESYFLIPESIVLDTISDMEFAGDAWT
jgi:arylamine N-acetyltransferase